MWPFCDRPLIGSKKDGACSRPDSSCWSTKQSWAQDGSWEEGSSCCGSRPEGQGPWQGTDSSSCGGQRTGQEAGCQCLGELLLQGQFRLKKKEREMDRVPDTREAYPLPGPHPGAFLPQGRAF